MRRIALALTLVMICYAAYWGTLPSSRNAAEAFSPRTTAEIELTDMTLCALALPPFSSREEAYLAAAESTRQGAAGSVIRDGTVWRVLLKGCADAAQARTEQACLLVKSGVETSVWIEKRAPARVRISARADQIAALSGALEHLEGLYAQTDALAAMTDQGQGDLSSVRSLTKVLSGQTEEARSDLETRLDGTENVFCKEIIRLMAEADDGLREALNAGSMLTLASGLRQTALAVRRGLIFLSAPGGKQAP